MSRQPADNQITQGICGTFDQRGPSFYSRKRSDSIPKGVFVKGDKRVSALREISVFNASLVLLFICFCLILSPVSVPISITRPLFCYLKIKLPLSPWHHYQELGSIGNLSLKSNF